jgi:hypothetical protein
MNREKQNAQGVDSHHDRRSKNRKAVTAAENQSNQLGSTGSITSEGFAPEDRPGAEKNLQAAESNAVRQRKQNELTRLLIKIRRGEIGYDAIDRFFNQCNGSTSKTNI